MINFELIGGVNFKKGCYPGQEIVARSQYLGKLKRRMMHASVTAGQASDQIAAGTEIFSADDPGQPCGMVVNAARANSQTIDCLVEIKLASADAEIHLGSADGPLLSFQPLPYPLTDPVA
jgi:folate-binding Fe-S cluster repair protein YgfZ